MTCVRSVQGLKRRPNECRIKTRLGSTSAQLLVDIATTIAVTSKTTTGSAENTAKNDGIRDAPITHIRVYSEGTPTSKLADQKPNPAYRRLPAAAGMVRDRKDNVLE